MSLVKVTNLQFNYRDNDLYNNAELQLNKGEHAVLVGKNGAGKTTLFDLLVGKLYPDFGEVTWTPHVTFSYLDQHYQVNDNYKVKEYLELIYKDLFDKEKRMNELYELGSNIDDPKFETYLNQASSINDELIMSDFYSIKEEIEKVLTGLGIFKDLYDAQLNRLSSGQREKVYLAKMLLENSDVLLLDEPTNYLDAPHVKWLIEYLNNYEKAFLVISHDVNFLSQIANVVFELSNKVITRYKGNYQYYLEQSVIRKEQYQKDYEAQQRYIKKEEEFIAAHIVRATSARTAKSRRTRLTHLERIEKPIAENNKVFFHFPYSGDIGKEILEVNDLEIGYDKVLLDPISFNVKKGEKIVIVGKNGVGKSTFIKTILNLIPSLGGTYHFNERKKINYFSQTEIEDQSLTPVEYIRSFKKNMTPFEARSLLARSGIKADMALRPLNKLSGGEEAKTRLCMLTLIPSNILILDEPTNHLDIVAKQSLKAAIQEYEGVVILITHEQDFYDGIVDYVIQF